MTTDYELRIDGARLTLTTDHSASSHGLPVLAYYDEAVGPADACRLRVEGGTDEALAALKSAGYEFDDCRDCE